MVLDFYELQEQAFGVTPDSRFLFSSATHREALAALLYGIEAGCGFVALIAKPGLGKTTLLFHAMHHLRDRVTSVFLFQTVCTPLDLMRVILNGLGVVEPTGNLVEMQLRLKRLLAERSGSGKRVVVVIDEAQNLDDSVLELVRMLSNFETSTEKLIQIVLAGQPQLADKIASPDLVQLRQRVAIVARLEPFSTEETALYIDHRLKTAGYNSSAPLFTKEALALIAEYSGGIPRNINNLCFNSMSLACALRLKPIDAKTIREVIVDLDLDHWRKTTVLAVGQNEAGPARIPTLFATDDAPHLLGGWKSKAAVAALVLLAVGGTLFASHRRLASRGAMQTNGVKFHSVPSPLPSDRSPYLPAGTYQPTPSSPAYSPAPTRLAAEAHSVTPKLATAPDLALPAYQWQEADETTIRVMPGKTLLGICVDKFGKCNPGLLQEIQRLNPRLSNLDHIEPGQALRIPSAPRILGASVGELPGEAPLEKKGMP